MDKDAEQKKLNDIAAMIAEYQNHAITQEFIRDEKEREDMLLTQICTRLPFDLESIIVHFAAIGELQGIRRRAAMLPAKLEEIQDKIKEL